MKNGVQVAAIIPALNEEEAIGRVVRSVPSWVDDTVVVDNGSTDRTVAVARDHGARTVSEPRRGYGAACLAGIAALRDPAVVVFLDGDYSDRPDEMEALVDPIIDRRADLVIGSRVLGNHEPGALTPQARIGNRLACALIRLFWKTSFTDLGPFRAIRHSSLRALAMRDRGYGWTVEMQIKAALSRLRILEVPVSYHRRIGSSKISGTFRGVIGAGSAILAAIFRSALSPPRLDPPPRDALVVFTRYPDPGKTKTRLIPALGAEGAADLHRGMTARTLVWARRLRRARPISLEVRYEGGDIRKMKQWLGPDLACRSQGSGDLGRRMEAAFRDAFLRGSDRVVLVGTDCPFLTFELAAEAFDALRDHDLVLGPSLDGGYYLIGLRRPAPELFDGPRWGTDTVSNKTLEIAARLGLSVRQLRMLGDVDWPRDLHWWEDRPDRPDPPDRPPRISVVIPSLDEGANISDTLAMVVGIRGTEAIVVDGGSSDGTAGLAAEYGARVLSARPCRAAQMNAGAAAARGDILLFLHADTRLPLDFAPSVLQAVDEAGVAAGAFELCIDAPGRALRFVERMANRRARSLRLPYGDQAIFVKAGLFRDLGGFPEIDIMEDYALVRRLRRRGKMVILPAPAATSPRRWRQLGPFRTTLINQIVILGYHCGFSPATLARVYRRKPSPPTPAEANSR